jgi:hypothetical protein
MFIVEHKITYIRPQIYLQESSPGDLRFHGVLTALLYHRCLAMHLAISLQLLPLDSIHGNQEERVLVIVLSPCSDSPR